MKEILMTDQPEKLDLRSPDIAEDKKQELLRLFPEIGAEGGKNPTLTGFAALQKFAFEA
jgi:hypothetical protein